MNCGQKHAASHEAPSAMHSVRLLTLFHLFGSVRVHNGPREAFQLLSLLICWPPNLKRTRGQQRARALRLLILFSISHADYFALDSNIC
eukprot:2015290-Pleurochrysis_carterae.AAC.1